MATIAPALIYRCGETLNNWHKYFMEFFAPLRMKVSHFWSLPTIIAMLLLSVVMPLAGQNFDASSDYTENETVGFIDANAPPSRQIMSQRFGPADAFITVALDVLKQLVYASQRFPVLSLPGKVFLPSLFVPNLTH